MAGRLDESGLGDEGVFEVLDLCLECRACKAECPVGVDVARFKSEFLAGYWQRHGLPLRARLVGHAHRLAKTGSAFAPLSNLVARSAPGRWINEQLLGIDRRRTPPAFARETFRARFGGQASSERQRQPAPSPQSLAPTVVLFADTFTNYNHPAVGMAAVDVLHAAGIGVRLANHGCCGRPLISQGLLDEARAAAQVNADALFEAASSGGTILFLEPSCLSAIREDAPALLRGEAQRKARIVGGASMLFEDYLEQEWAAGRLALDLKPGPAKVLLHGHCHQNAMGLVPSTRALLARVPSCTVVDLDAGCCGMAGSFGYAKEHYELSRQIGERKLLPAARTLAPDAVLVAPGTSCREQVAHFTGVKALHPAQLLRSLMTQEVRN
jgi:Fe-S oxidoreductase